MGTVAVAVIAGLALLGLGALLVFFLRRNGVLAQQLAAERAQAQARLEAASQAQEQLRSTFADLAGQALRSNNETFLNLAKQNLEKLQQQAKGDLELKEKAVESLVRPIRESLDKMNQQVQEVEKTRAAAYGSLTEQVKGLLEAQNTLKVETGKLVQALHNPQERGHWGELQLKNVLEAAGLRAGLDYEEQPSVPVGDGRLRPDVVVKLPDGGSIVIDAKAPLEAFLRSYDAPNEEERRAAVQEHIRMVKTHIAALSGKEYWGLFSPAPEFVVMFLPGEAFFIAALEQAPDLIRDSVEQRVILASPITLIALLRAVSYGWRQKRLEEQAHQIGELGAAIYDRLAIMTEHFNKLRDKLVETTGAYNATIGSLERNVLPAARRFVDLGIPANREVLELEPIEEVVRRIEAKELVLAKPAGRGEAEE